MAKGSIAIDIDVDGRDIREEFTELANDWPAHEAAVRLAIGEKLVGGMKRAVDGNTGRLRGTIRTLESGDTTRVVAGGTSGVDYVLPYLEGSRPHAPGPPDPASNPSLARWARRNNFPGGFDGIYWHIAREGTEAHDFVSKPLEETGRSSDRIADRVLAARGAFE